MPPTSRTVVLARDFLDNTIVTAKGLLREEPDHLIERGDVAVDHVDDLELVAVEVHGRGGAAVLDDDDVEGLVGEAAHGRGHALIGEDPGDHDVPDAHIVQDQPQIGAGERAVRGRGGRALIGGSLGQRNGPDRGRDLPSDRCGTLAASCETSRSLRLRVGRETLRTQ
jgi:hypothetical protein